MIEQWKIISITHLDGTPRNDKFYPDITGKKVDFALEPVLNERFCFGVEHTDSVTTTPVQRVSNTRNTMKVQTLTTIYTFERVEE